MKIINPFQHLFSQIWCDSADFDGTNDRLDRSALTGAVDSKSGILSAWARFDNGSGLQRILQGYNQAGGVTTFRLIKNATTNILNIHGGNVGGTEILAINSNTAYVPAASWFHILSSWDLATASASLYINDVSDLAASPTLTNDTIDYTVNDWAVGATVTSGGGLFDGCLAEIYFAPGQYLDFSVESNRRKFISPAGKPVNLGSDGSLPTGTTPIIYLHLDKSEAVANFATNRGAGGNFTITDVLTTGSTSPSD